MFLHNDSFMELFLPIFEWRMCVLIKNVRTPDLPYARILAKLRGALLFGRSLPAKGGCSCIRLTWGLPLYLALGGGYHHFGRSRSWPPPLCLRIACSELPGRGSVLGLSPTL